mmetsp:Transcript_11974/g.18148  ORF Transcript_11974/g.18148 Transcript_11974/m.18148 type:complete len:98 (+) Transcript_11974:94-387(+)
MMLKMIESNCRKRRTEESQPSQCVDWPSLVTLRSCCLRISHVYFSNRAAVLCYLERYEEAELDSERPLALVPEFSKAHAKLGLSPYFLKDYEGSVEF